jgi:hypothetical protein
MGKAARRMSRCCRFSRGRQLPAPQNGGGTMLRRHQKSVCMRALTTEAGPRSSLYAGLTMNW